MFFLDKREELPGSHFIERKPPTQVPQVQLRKEKTCSNAEKTSAKLESLRQGPATSKISKAWVETTPIRFFASHSRRWSQSRQVKRGDSEVHPHVSLDLQGGSSLLFHPLCSRKGFLTMLWMSRHKLFIDSVMWSLKTGLHFLTSFKTFHQTWYKEIHDIPLKIILFPSFQIAQRTLAHKSLTWSNGLLVIHRDAKDSRSP